ncbi:MAG TPA: elongation factor P maturation arginine rhamnosyltransferase EarP [Sideroxyarcus sp.]|nr:elongation factor P maturation arginine rhamnosyltransferase EarP [Sideroxyarcus sp.]
MKNETCDIFCNVVDNFGDIGVCWRLARQLANEHGISARLWVDDLASFAKLCPEAGATLEQQHCRGVEVRHWSRDFPVVEPAGLVIEAFACKLPQPYIEAMAAKEHKPVWINLEYLSAEDWVEGCHRLPSPHATLPLTKYFFFPGFTGKTGGLLLERDLLARRDAFQSEAEAQGTYWLGLDMPPRVAGELRVSMFGYENAAMEDLLRGWEQGAQPVTCLLPEGRSLPQVAAFFGQSFDGLRTNGSMAGTIWQRGQLRVRVLPFVEQERYDELLWACDVNFVRGEDSCVRAQWAGKPFIWQIYPQHDGVHLEKLQAFMNLYCEGLSDRASQAVQALWLNWNCGKPVGQEWLDFLSCREELQVRARVWAQRLSGNNLALNLLDFSRQVA